MSEINPKKEWFYPKCGLLVTFVAIDVYISSKTEYEMDATNIQKVSQLQMIFLGCSLLLQVSIASALFLLLCNTLPFQVGLLFPFQTGIFKGLLILQPVYMILTSVIGGMRLVSRHLASV